MNIMCANKPACKDRNVILDFRDFKVRAVIAQSNRKQKYSQFFTTKKN